MDQRSLGRHSSSEKIISSISAKAPARAIINITSRNHCKYYMRILAKTLPKFASDRNFLLCLYCIPIDIAPFFGYNANVSYAPVAQQDRASAS